MYKGTLIVEGGANRGIFASGVIDLFLDKNLDISHVVGVSAGTCNTIDYVSQQRGRTHDCIVVEDPKNQYIKFSNIFKPGKSYVDLDLSITKACNVIYPFDFETYRKSPKKSYITVTNKLTGKAEYLDELKNRDRLISLTKASCTMPIICPETIVDGIPYYDGGIADAIPLKFSQSLGNDKIIIILSRPLSYQKKEITNFNRKMISHKFSNNPEFLKTYFGRAKRYNDTLEEIKRLEKEGKVFVYRPVYIVKRTETDHEKLNISYDEGYNNALKRYQDLIEFLKK